MKKLLNEKISEAGFKYLIERISSQNISHIKYKTLEMQDYLLDGNKNVKVAQFISKARSMTLDIKMQRKWKYKDMLCIGFGEENETGEAILKCSGYSEFTSEDKPVVYSLFYYGNALEMAEVAKIMLKRLKVREKRMEKSPD